MGELEWSEFKGKVEEGRKEGRKEGWKEGRRDKKEDALHRRAMT